MTLNEYQKLAERTMNHKLSNTLNEFHALHGMAGEVGEIHSIYQKHYQGHDFNKEELKKETGDLLWFLAEYCTVMGWTMDEVAVMNIEKLQRRYPEGFAEGLSVNRTE